MSIIEKKGTIIKPDDKTMNEQVGMNGEEGEGKSDNKKKGVLNEPLAYWYSICKTGIWNIIKTANCNTNETRIKFSEWNLTFNNRPSYI
jgi:hypothetical protein